MNIGETVPDFKFKATTQTEACLADYKGKWVVLYFYPKDSTPGCTIETRDFKAAYPHFLQRNAVILGISRDTMKSHERFKCNLDLPFELISDADETLCQLFDVIKVKSMFGKKMRGIVRSTFLIDPLGRLVYEWRKVSVIGHVENVLEFIEAQQST